jgi:HAD superfamily hydrolase (TIGR01509 family)
VPFQRVRACIGMGADKLLPAVAGIDAESRGGRAIAELRGRIFMEKWLPHVRPFPRVRELLERMRDDGLRLAVASSAQKEELHALLEIAGVASFIEEHTSSDDVEESKPDPDVVHAALERLDLPAAAVTMIGDTPYDVEAAQRAHVGIIGLRCGGWDDAALAGAIAVYADPADLLAHYVESPSSAG